MAKGATVKGEGSARKKSSAKRKAAGAKRGRATSDNKRSSRSAEGGTKIDPVDALIKLLQSPLMVDLLAVGATAALATITEKRSSRVQGVAGSSRKAVKEAGKAAASAIGRRLATEFEEIRKASKKPGESRKAKAGEAA